MKSKGLAWSLLVTLAVVCPLSRAQDASVGEILHRVSETYKSLSSFHFVVEKQSTFTMSGAQVESNTERNLAVVPPDKVRLSVKDSDQEVILVSDGRMTWTFIPQRKQYTQEGAAAIGGGGEEEQGGDSEEEDMLTVARREIVGRYTGVERFASQAHLEKTAKIKGPDGKVECYVIQAQIGERTHELWIDEQRFLVLRHNESRTINRNGISVRAITTTTLKEVAMGTLPESTFLFTPPSNARQVQALGLPGEHVNLTGRAAADFTLRDLQGEKVSLSGLRGKIVVLDFWATWCGPCREELPKLVKLGEQFKDSDVVVLGVSDEESGTVKGFLKKNAYDLETLLDANDNVHRLFAVRAIPTILVVDRRGVVSAHFVGEPGEGELVAALHSAGVP